MKDKLDLKNQPSTICYVEMLQNNISRMSQLSGIVKAAMCVVYTILITVVLEMNILDKYWWIAILLTILGMILDAYYLAMEKIYVAKYNSFIEDLNNSNVKVENIYDMKPRNTKLKSELLAEILLSLKSYSILGFYIIFILIGILIKIL